MRENIPWRTLNLHTHNTTGLSNPFRSRQGEREWAFEPKEVYMCLQKCWKSTLVANISLYTLRHMEPTQSHESDMHCCTLQRCVFDAFRLFNYYLLTLRVNILYVKPSHLYLHSAYKIDCFEEALQWYTGK